MKRQPYTYVILRYRHDPVAGEFLNVGVIMVAPESCFLGVKVRKSLGRLGKTFPGIQRAEVTGALASIRYAIEKYGHSLSETGLFSDREIDADKIAKKALPLDESSYFWGPLCSGVTSDPQATIESLFARFVARYDEETKHGRDDSAVWQPVREELAKRDLLDRLQPKKIVSPIDEVEFGSAWKNGVWHCYQALSFDLVTSEGIREKAARWSGHMTGLSKAEEDIQPYFIVGAPSDPALENDYSRAINLLRESSLNPKVFVESQSGELAELIATQMTTRNV